MAAKAERTEAQERQEAENLIRQILETDFGQRLDRKTVDEVAERVRKTLPRRVGTEKAPAA
jgi:hypothetical protein